MCHFKGEIYIKSEYVNVTVTANTLKLPQFSRQVRLDTNIIGGRPD